MEALERTLAAYAGAGLALLLLWAGSLFGVLSGHEMISVPWVFVPPLGIAATLGVSDIGRHFTRAAITLRGVISLAAASACLFVAIVDGAFWIAVAAPLAAAATGEVVCRGRRRAEARQSGVR